MIDQNIFDGIFSSILDLDYTVYDTLPDLTVPYPFAVMGDINIHLHPIKTRMMGTASVSIHVWEDDGNRRQASEMMNRITVACMNLKEAGQFKLIPNPQSGYQRLLVDGTTEKSLWHGVIELEYKFYKGE